MENIIGLGDKKSPFLYLDDYVKQIDLNLLNNEIAKGIALSNWNKRFVSSGVHDEWADKEITPYIRNLEKHLTPEQVEIFASFKTTDEKLKFISCILPVPHPFWIVYLRNNKRIDSSGINNKAVSADCHWTENALHFPTLVEFIKSMPFEGIGRVMLFMTESNNQTVPHFDAGTQEQRSKKPNDDFIWFTTSQHTKKIYVMNSVTKEKFYTDPTKKYIWFNEMDYHGTDAVPYFTFSIRIDGKFLPDIKSRLLSRS
jgi:hypothetical protein